MTQTKTCAVKRNGHAFATKKAQTQGFGSSLLLTAGIIFSLLLSSCQKQSERPSLEVAATEAEVAILSSPGSGNVPGQYDLPGNTSWELQQTRAATARYKHLSNALRDGYTALPPVTHAPNMGHHFMKASLLDGQFDYRKPEILVYSKDANNNYELVAVEFAVPNTFAMPAGYSGDHDMWMNNTTFGLWVLHAWVWKYNPSGVFHPTNPMVNSIP